MAGAVAPAVRGPRRVGITVIGWGVAIAVRRIAVGGIVTVRRIICAVIAALIRSCQRAADDGADGKAAQRRTPPAPAGIRGAWCGEGCEGDGRGCSDSG